MKRPANALSDAVIREARPIALPDDADIRLVGDWPMVDGRHALVISIPNDTVIEIRKDDQ
jgi:hypothetical protein